MPFKKGISGNPEGRKKGVANKSTEEIRSMLQLFIESNIETLQSCFDSLEPNQKLTFFNALLKHILPAPLHELEKLTDDQLDQLITKLKNKEI
jgi:hypothetical protein